MNNRKLAIIHTKQSCAENVKNSVSVFLGSGLFDETTVYVAKNITAQAYGANVRVESIPDAYDTEPKVRNWINSSHSEYGGFLHVVKDDTEIVSDPSRFIGDIERMMRVLDYGVWLSTVTDACNYVYSKYNPRLAISMNERGVNEKLGFTCDIYITSHSNTYWMVYDCQALRGTDLLKFDERYTISMFYIIEFLARRRNSKCGGSVYFMNQYFTVSSELGVFRKFENAERDVDDPKIMQLEDGIFKGQNVNYAPDANVDVLLETFWEKLVGKMGDSASV